MSAEKAVVPKYQFTPLVKKKGEYQRICEVLLLNGMQCSRIATFSVFGAEINKTFYSCVTHKHLLGAGIVYKRPDEREEEE